MKIWKFENFEIMKISALVTSSVEAKINFIVSLLISRSMSTTGFSVIINTKGQVKGQSKSSGQFRVSVNNQFQGQCIFWKEKLNLQLTKTQSFLSKFKMSFAWKIN